MARLPRLVVPGLPHYLLQLGNNGQAIFLDRSDREQFLDLLHDAVKSHAVALHAYALLDSALHLLLRPEQSDALARLMQDIGRRYVGGFNRRHGRSGTLWQGRYRAGVIEPGASTLDCLRRIDSLAAAGPWCSAAHRLGQGRDPLVSDPPEYWALGNTPFEREAAYGALLARPLDERRQHELEQAALKGWALGSTNFLAELASSTQRPVRPRPRGRPPLTVRTSI